jgi:hypothetical protein
MFVTPRAELGQAQPLQKPAREQIGQADTGEAGFRNQQASTKP